MRFDLIIPAEVFEELWEAVQWYENIEMGLGDGLVSAFHAALQRVADNPYVFPLRKKNLRIRRVLLKRFPYKIYFTISGRNIAVISLVHTASLPSGL